ncbi:type VII secretion integral membrane protein EccD [Mycobacterium sp. E2327]|uniref:type VII secretion integral membrane protein EccD n=1 Tax=Mycobacterium sp. E2327 TaxID=1834132 RepID=UPI0007FE1A62|nr:type VII secretion integral membrane protein EccD [Mycobacterium sp. E2327]OBI22227.1 type VII secretion integral membrane protein EccD [Mycobacterium sp. E2327]
MPETDPGLRRVSIHAGTAVTDLSLPGGVPVAVLIPSIVDILDGRGGHGVRASGHQEARRYQLSCPGAAPLATSATLAQNGIRDGAVLVLTESSTPAPPPHFDDVAPAVSATLDAAGRSWPACRRRRAARIASAVTAALVTGIGALALIRNAPSANVTGATVGVVASAGLLALLFAAVAHRAYGDATAGLALGVIAAVFAAVAGFLAVPGGPGLPNVVLAGTAAATTAVLAARVSGCGAVPLASVSCVATSVALAALAGVITAAPLRAIGAVSALASLGLLGVAPLASITLAGLSPQRPPGSDVEAKAIRADNWLAGLLAALLTVAAVGAIVTVLAGAPRLSCIAFGALTGALLMLRARSDDVRRTLVFLISGIAIAATTFGVVATSMLRSGSWTAALTATLAAAAIYVGFVAPTMSLSPLARRGVDALECVALVALVPTTSWVCGLYHAVRELNLR